MCRPYGDRGEVHGGDDLNSRSPRHPSGKLRDTDATAMLLTQGQSISAFVGLDVAVPKLKGGVPVRSFAMAILMAIGLGLAVTSGAVAARINAASIGKSASEISPVTTIHYTGYYHRHRYRPYYYGYGYGYGYPYGFYYYGYPYRPYYGYPYRRWWW